MARLLREQGWRVTVVWPPADPPRWRYRIGLGPLWLSRAAARAAGALGPVQLIVTNVFLGAGFPSNIPRVHVYHGTMVRHSVSIRRWLPRRELVRRVLGGGVSDALSARGATIVCVSSSTAAEVRRFYGVKADAVVPNAVDTTVFRPIPRADARARLGLPADVRLALFVGRPDPGKGIDLLPAATWRAGYDLAVAGPGRLPGARHLGVLSPPQLALAYCAADCVVLPSSYEACSFVVLEALACGAPLITTRVGWMNDLLREYPAYDALCVQPNEEEIVDRLTRLSALADPKMLHQVRDWVAEHHNLDTYAARWSELLTSLTGTM
ncbi:MAG: glycosyltransferase family 4 protein [Solirubrobacterales bacterium]|nr:glycosyltransferase family 4 protein [Solirubrobacterales bacterium]